MTGRAVLIVSLTFPPSTLAGVHRARHLAKHLPAHGWQPIVLCVDERYHEERLDPELARLLPAATEVVRVPAISPTLTRPLGMGDIGMRSFFFVRSTILRMLKHRPVDAVLITGAPFLPMVLAPLIRKRFGVPVVLDFQDPWFSAWGAQQPRWSKAGIMHRLAKALEPGAVREASAIVSVSDMQNAEMMHRYPFLKSDLFSSIPIGGDPEDFDAVRSLGGKTAEGLLRPGVLNLSFVGTFMPRSGPIVKLLFAALMRLTKEDPGIGERLRLNFVGTSNSTLGTEKKVTGIARSENVDSLVFEHPQRVPFLEALSVLAKSEAVLMLGSDEPHYTASKIYPGLMCGRPFISVFHEASSSHAILSSAGGGDAHVFNPGDDQEPLISGLLVSLRKLLVDTSLFGKVDPKSYYGYTAHAVAGSFAAVLERVHRCA